VDTIFHKAANINFLDTSLRSHNFSKNFAAKSTVLVAGFDVSKQIQPNCYQKGIIASHFYFLLPR